MEEIREKIKVVETRMEEDRKELAQLYHALTEWVQSRKREVETREVELNMEKTKFTAMSQNIQDVVVSRKIRLDIGGRIFAMTLEELTKFEDSFFGRMFSGRWEEQQCDDGTFFINRSFTHFHHIADFMRYETLELEITQVEKGALLVEAKFYGMDDLIQSLEPCAAPTLLWGIREVTAIESNGLTLKRTYEGPERFADTCGTVALSGVQTWSIRIDEMSSNSEIIVGVVSQRVKIGLLNRQSHNSNIPRNVINCRYKLNTSIKKGDIIYIRCDLNNGCMYYGLELSSMFQQLMAGPDFIWYPYFSLDKVGDQITVISQKCVKSG